MTTNEYTVSGMTCGHCETAIRTEVAQIPGVTDITVSAATGRLVVGGDGQVDDAAVIAAVDEAGYEASKG